MISKFIHLILVVLLSFSGLEPNVDINHNEDNQNIQNEIKDNNIKENNTVKGEEKNTAIKENNTEKNEEKDNTVKENVSIKDNNETNNNKEQNKVTNQETNEKTDSKENETPNEGKENNITDTNNQPTTDIENNTTEDNKTNVENEIITDNESAEKESTEPVLTNEQKSAKKIVDNIITPSMSDFSKALAIHDWLTFNVDYDRTYTSSTVESTLSKRVAICSGYAKTFKMMAELAGLEVEIITGTGNGEAHAWNQVKINGVWYNVDVTWDDPTSSDKKASDHTSNRYDYFLVSDATLRKDHIPDTSPHNCSSDYNRITVLKSGINNGYRSNHGFATNQTEANNVIKKMAEAGYNEFYIWYYNTLLTKDNMWDEFTNLTKTSVYPVAVANASLPNNNVIRYKVQLKISTKEWANIPVAHNNLEFASICNSHTTNEEFLVRYESTDGNYDISGVTYGYSYYVTEYGNSYRLYTIIPKV